VVRALDRARIEYMVTGSIASSFLGEPRATHDIDVVAEMTTEVLPALATAFPAPEYYWDPSTAQKAIVDQGMFNVIATDEGDKVDFWMLTDDAFDQSRFARRQPHDVFGISIQFPTAEDAILAKLAWSKQVGGSTKQLHDALRIFEVNAAQIDNSYMERWATELSVLQSWRALQGEAEGI